MDKANIYILISGVLFFAIAFSTIGAIPWVLDQQTQSHEITTVDGRVMAVPNPYNVGTTPQLTVAGEGREFYMVQICYQCHSQFVRPLAHEVDLYGPSSQAGESSWDTPMLFGTKRTGPDLAREGGRRTDDWHLAHFYDPRWTQPESVMQPYDSHFTHDSEPADPQVISDEERAAVQEFFNPPPMPAQESGEADEDYDERIKEWQAERDEQQQLFDKVRNEFMERLLATEADSQDRAWKWRDGWVRAAIRLFDTNGDNRLDRVEKDKLISGLRVPQDWIDLVNALDFDRDTIITLSDARPQASENVEKLVNYLQYLGTAIGDWREQSYTGAPIRPANSPVVQVQNLVIELDAWASDPKLADRTDEFRRLYGRQMDAALQKAGKEPVDWANPVDVKAALIDWRQDLIANQIVKLWRDRNDRGRNVYTNKCAGCHGDKGDGSGNAVMFLGRALNKYRYMDYLEYDQQVTRENALRDAITDETGQPTSHQPLLSELQFEEQLKPALYGDYLAMPRDFTQALYKFATRPKPAGGQKIVPTDEDLFATISRGVYGSSMPNWNRLPEEDRWAVIDYIKSFSLDEVRISVGADGREGTEDDQMGLDSLFLNAASNPAPMVVPSTPRTVDEPANIWRGRFVFMAVGCTTCHGANGQASNYSNQESWTGRTIQARNFTQAPLLKGGDQPHDIYRTLRTGINGTPMPAYRLAEMTFGGGKEVADTGYARLKAVQENGEPAYRDAGELQPYQAWLAAQPDADALGKMSDADKQQLVDARTWALVGYVRWLMRTKGRIDLPPGEAPKQ